MKTPRLYETESSAISYDKCRRGHPDFIKGVLASYPLPERGRIADVGCGTGNETVFLVEHAKRRIWGVDRSKAMLDAAKRKLGKHLKCELADAEKGLPFEDSSFEYVFSSFTYHQMKSTYNFFQEICRILKPRGRFVLVGATCEQALARPLLRFFPQLIDIEKRRYLSLDELISTFWRAGFANVKSEARYFETRTIDDKYLERVRLKELNSALSYLTPNEMQEGLKKVEAILDEGLSFDVVRTVITGVRPQQLSTLKKVYSYLVADTELAGEEIVVERCAGGVMNQVFRVKSGEHSQILKQGTATAYSTEIDDLLARMSPERTVDEYKALSALHRAGVHWQVRLPKVHDFHEADNLLVLEDIQDNGTLMSEESIDASLRIQTFKTLSKFLALQHNEFEGKGWYLRENAERDYSKWRKTFHLRTTSLPKSGKWPGGGKSELLNSLSRKANEILKTGVVSTLVNPDLCPKNVFVYSNSEFPGVFDLEFCAGMGDPVYDLGFLVGHAIIHAVLYGTRTAAEECVSSYNEVLPLGNRYRDVAWYAACTIIYRIYGASKLIKAMPAPLKEILVQSAELIIAEGGGSVERLLPVRKS